MAARLKGGKTPPRLLDDLELYNPNRLPASAFNILTSIEIPLDLDAPGPKKTGKGACRHVWLLQPRQSTLLASNRHEALARQVITAVCSECRDHVQLELENRQDGARGGSCPTTDFPLHHFVYADQDSANFKDTGETSRWEDERVFQCSAPPCLARLTVRMRSPRLQHEWVEMLLDQDKIDSRAKAAIASNTERLEGHALPRPINVMSNLQAYIRDALRGEKKHILANNKKWLLSLGDPCSDMLYGLHFERRELEWIPPQPDPLDQIPFSSDLSVLLDDVDLELSILLSKQPPEDKAREGFRIQWTPAVDHFRTFLGCSDYKLNPGSRRKNLPHEDEHPYYSGLGAVMDFHDDLIEFSYTSQVNCDAENTPAYLECFEGIARGRSSEQLQTRAAIEASSGAKSLQDIRKAYRSFGLEMGTPLDEDTIIGMFQARAADAPRQEAQLRQDLAVIGQDRKSAKIIQFASDSISTVEQAFTWLGATEEMDDSFLVSMFGVKIGENPAHERLARVCISLIADQRGSKALKSWLDTGILQESEMDIAQAYARLDIGDRTMGDEIVLATFNLAVQDAPSQQAELRRALTAIARDRHSAMLQGFLESGMVSADHRLDDWPVGLENIGNTCYLNSLLQFYFTIRPLRDLVLNYEDHKVDATGPRWTSKQVGSRQISRKEAQRAQRFIYELQRLFLSMISADRAQVVPEQELARLTLLSSSTEEIFRRRSTLNGSRPQLAAPAGPHQQTILDTPVEEMSENTVLNGAVVQPGLLNLPTDKSLPARDNNVRQPSASSDSTLVEKPLQVVEEDAMLVDETTAEPAEISAGDQNMVKIEHAAQPGDAIENASTAMTGSDSPGSSSPQARAGGALPTPSDDHPVSPAAKGDAMEVAASMQPHPTPPPAESSGKEDIQRQLEFGAQQDVTEAISNVLFQLQCGIKPDAVDDNGEQIDRIKRLFFGKQKTTTIDNDGKARTKEEYFSDIKIQVASPRDLYAALDAAFDEQEVEVGAKKESQFTTISVIPPILQFHVARAQYDREKRTLFKSNHHLEMPKTIYMDRYMDDLDPELAQRRKDSQVWKRELARLREEQESLATTKLGVSMPEALDSMTQYLRSLADNDDGTHSLQVRPELSDALAVVAQQARERLEAIATRIRDLDSQIASQFSDRRELPYRLHSVFIHRGLATSGHYWIYIYDFARDLWRKYNDGYVTAVKDVQEIFETEAGIRPATSSFLVYIREGMEVELTDAVMREIADKSPATLTGEGQDVPQAFDSEAPEAASKAVMDASDQGSGEEVDIIMTDNPESASLGEPLQSLPAPTTSAPHRKAPPLPPRNSPPRYSAEPVDGHSDVTW